MAQGAMQTQGRQLWAARAVADAAVDVAAA